MRLRLGLALALGVVSALPAPAAAQADEEELIPAPRQADPTRFNEGVAAYDAGNHAAAFTIWLPLAQGGDVAAMRNVAHLLRKGLGTDKDLVRALAFYKRAAEAGLPGAQANLAMMYLAGEGTKRDAKEAARWLYAATRGGHVIAAHELAKLIEAGDGVPKDMAVAKALYARAAGAGYPPAKQRLAALGGAPAAADRAGLALGQPSGSASTTTTRPKGTMDPVADDPPRPARGSMEPIADDPPRLALPRPRPGDAIKALVAPPPLRGVLGAGFEALQMPPEAAAGQETLALAFAGFDYDFTFGAGAPSPELCEPVRPFDRRSHLCRMAAIPD